MHDTIGVILAAGAGSRFWPYNEVRNKCATSVANTPNVLRIARQLRGLGIARIVVTVGAHAGSIRHALLGLAEEGRLDFVDAGPAAGTAHGLLEAWRHTEAERALVVYGDVATDASNLARVLAALMEGAPAAALWDVAPPGTAQEWIGVRLGSEGTLKYEMAPADRLLGARRGDAGLAEIEVPPEKEVCWRVEAEFIDAIRGRGKIEFTDFAAGLRYMEFTEAVARSAARGQPVTLPLEDEE